jgi:hypothetical protein
MEIVFPDSSYYNNYRDTIFGCMVKQKLELSFTQGFLIGAVFSVLFMSVIIDKLFISKELFSETKRIYVDGRIYKLCRDN